MLTASQFDQLLTPILELFDDFTQSVLNDIARRLVKAGGITATAAWQMMRLLESGLVYTDALDMLAMLTGKSQVVLKMIFDKAGVETMTFDNTIYKVAGLRPLPIPLSPAMQSVLLAGLRKTAGEVYNLVLTTAIDGQNAFIDALDTAYMQVVHGTMGYDQAIKAAIKHTAREGLRVIDFRGHKDQIDVAVRRAVLTGVAQTTGNLQMYGAMESGIDLVQTSAHIGARPSHEVWQGKVFSVFGKTPGYPLFSETGYGTIGGLCGINCRHSFYPFYKGISENAYKQATLHEYAEKKVMFNGKEGSVYEATQHQRAIEREIRKTKREAIALGEAGIDNTEEVMKIHTLQADMRDFIGQTGLNRQSVREGGKVETVRRE
jgi:hypothetical protein